MARDIALTLGHLLSEGSVRVADRAEAKAVIAEWYAREAAKQPTPEEIAAEHDWLAQQEPGDENERATEESKRRGIDFNAAYTALNRGDHDEAERFLQDLAPPPQHMVAALERRINTAFTFARSRARAAEPPADHGSQPVQRPRERRATSRARARSPGRDDGSPSGPRRSSRLSASGGRS